MTERSKAIVWSLILTIAFMVAGSWLFHLAYIYTLIGLLAWLTVGHLVTIDDDAPGGWSNPEESKSIGRASVRSMAWKFCVLLFVIGLAVAFPALTKFGAQ